MGSEHADRSSGARTPAWPGARPARSRRRGPFLSTWVGALCLLGLATGASAYTLLFGKWDDPTQGTPAVVTWGFIAPGEGLGPSAPAAWSGTNTLGTGHPVDDLRARIDAVHGAGAFDAALERAFATWAAATNLSFVRDPVSGGAFATVTEPDIRIGAYVFGDFAGGAGFGPPGDDLSFPDALAGDLALNHPNNFTIAAGVEGDPIPRVGGEIQNDLESLFLHEIGHTLGLGHSDVVDAVMCGFIFGSPFDPADCVGEVIERELTADDLAGIRQLYGPAVPAVHGVGGWGLVALLVIIDAVTGRLVAVRPSV